MYVRNSTLSMYIKSYPITSTIIILQICLCIVLFLPFFPHQPVYHELVGINLNISQGEVWRLITPLFVHVNFSHFFYNTLSIALIGPFMEGSLGKWRFTILFLLSGIIGNIATFLFLPLSYAHVGSSGAISGILGSFLLYVLQKKFLIPKQNQLILLLLILVSVIMTMYQSDVNNIAHLAGFLTGFCLGWIFSSLNFK